MFQIYSALQRHTTTIGRHTPYFLTKHWLHNIMLRCQLNNFCLPPIFFTNRHLFCPLNMVVRCVLGFVRYWAYNRLSEPVQIVEVKCLSTHVIKTLHRSYVMNETSNQNLILNLLFYFYWWTIRSNLIY